MPYSKLIPSSADVLGPSLPDCLFSHICLFLSISFPLYFALVLQSRPNQVQGFRRKKKEDKDAGALSPMADESLRIYIQNKSPRYVHAEEGEKGDAY